MSTPTATTQPRKMSLFELTRSKLGMSGSPPPVTETRSKPTVITEESAESTQRKQSDRRGTSADSATDSSSTASGALGGGSSGSSSSSAASASASTAAVGGRSGGSSAGDGERGARLEKVKATYARDMWDSHGLKQIASRLDAEKKSVKSMSSYFGDWSKASYNSHSTLSKFRSLGLSELEQGSLGFCITRVGELIETESKNNEILSHKMKAHCQTRLMDDLKRTEKVTSKLLSDIQVWHKNEAKEMKALNKAKHSYDDRKKALFSAREYLANEQQRLAELRVAAAAGSVSHSKVTSLESSVKGSLTDKVQSAEKESRLALDGYCKQLSRYRGFRLRFDVETSQLLDSLEQCSRERAKLVHTVLLSYLEISRVMAEQTLRNCATIYGHIEDALHSDADNEQWIEVSRSGRRKPPLPDPILHPEDVAAVVEQRKPRRSSDLDELSTLDEQSHATDSMNIGNGTSHGGSSLPPTLTDVSSSSAAAAMGMTSMVGGSGTTGGIGDSSAMMVSVGGSGVGRLDSPTMSGSSKSMSELSPMPAGTTVWRDKWRMLVSCILGRDVDMSLGDPSMDTGFISLSESEMAALKAECLESLKGKSGRLAFATILNRQRNARDKGLEILKQSQFDEMCGLVNAFLDCVLEDSPPMHVKPAKLVMIMCQSLFIKRENLTSSEEHDDKEELLDPASLALSAADEGEEMDEIEAPPKVIRGGSSSSSSSSSKSAKMKKHSRMPSYVPVRGDKIYISDRVKRHGLWQKDAFWRECFFESVQQELQKYPLSQCWHAQAELDEAQSRNEAIMFSQLAAYTHNMKEFGMPVAAIIEFVQSQALPKDKLMMLEATLGIPELQESKTDSPKDGSVVGITAVSSVSRGSSMDDATDEKVDGSSLELP